MARTNIKERLIRRHARIRAVIRGTHERPRLSVFRSNKHFQAQLIDDEKGVTMLAVSDLKIKKKGTKQEHAALLGEEIAKKAKAKGVARVVFDRGGFRYHGRLHAFAEAARKGGLVF